MSENMNIKLDSGALERGLGQMLHSLLTGASWLGGWRVWPSSDPDWDLQAEGPGPAGQMAVLCVEVKKYLSPSQFRSLADRPCDAPVGVVARRVLAMPGVSPRLAELCRDHGWSWYDLAGNCRLEIPGVLLIERSGLPPVRLPKTGPPNLGTPEAGRVVRALLAPQNAGRRWTQRSIVHHFAAELSVPVPVPSLSLVNKVIQHLRGEAFLELLPERGFRISDHEGLLRAWRDAYRFNRHGRRTWFTLLRGPTLDERLLAFDRSQEGHGRALYAAFSAADYQASAVRQPRTWLFVDPFGETALKQALRSDRETALMHAIEAKPVETGDNIVVLIPGDPGVFYEPDVRPGRLACTNAVQTYVDLWHAGGRGTEAAEAILDQYLKPAWSRR
jgi:hypothetical protein